ncbi:unnamed protein product [Polarella glacialis]|uniref:Uncharacterized protein n=1 Tax=Polarella glacialis TaxID=89957 RepID=A0A813ITH4_POLGL|nr:unnamed protein product [Polarella glacialis]
MHSGSVTSGAVGQLSDSTSRRRGDSLCEGGRRMSPPRAADRLGQRLGFDTLAFRPGGDRGLQPSRGGGLYSREQRRAAATWPSPSPKGSNAFSECDATMVGAVTGRTRRNLAGRPGPGRDPGSSDEEEENSSDEEARRKASVKSKKASGRATTSTPAAAKTLAASSRETFLTSGLQGRNFSPQDVLMAKLIQDMAGTKSKPNKRALEDGNDSESGTDDCLDGSLFKKGRSSIRNQTGKVDQNSGSESAPADGTPGEVNGATQGEEEEEEVREGGKGGVAGPVRSAVHGVHRRPPGLAFSRGECSGSFSSTARTSMRLGAAVFSSATEGCKDELWQQLDLVGLSRLLGKESPLLCNDHSAFCRFHALLLKRATSNLPALARSGKHLFPSDLPFPDAEQPGTVPKSPRRRQRFLLTQHCRCWANSLFAPFSFWELGCPDNAVPVCDGRSIHMRSINSMLHF